MPQLYVARKNSFNPDSIRPVKNQHFVKPDWGLWTSTFNPEGKYASGWVEWCAGEMPEWIVDMHAFLLTVSPTARVYTIDSLGDLVSLVSKYPLKTDIPQLKQFEWIDWEAVSRDYDGVYLTDEGQWATRFSTPSLYGWDSESTLWFRNVFTKVVPYEGVLVRLNKAGYPSSG